MLLPSGFVIHVVITHTNTNRYPNVSRVDVCSITHHQYKSVEKVAKRNNNKNVKEGKINDI